MNNTENSRLSAIEAFLESFIEKSAIESERRRLAFEQEIQQSRAAFEQEIQQSRAAFEQEMQQSRAAADEKMQKIRDAQVETDQLIKRLQAEAADAQTKAAKAQAEVAEESKRNNQEIRALQAETDRQIKKSQAETDRLIKALTEQVTGISNSNGIVAEDYFFNSFHKDKLNFFGEKFDKAIRGKGSIVNDEYDFILINGKTAGIVEVKYKARKDDIPKALKKVAIVKF